VVLAFPSSLEVSPVFLRTLDCGKFTSSLSLVDMDQAKSEDDVAMVVVHWSALMIRPHYITDLLDGMRAGYSPAVCPNSP
jgi:hypothetical protein